MRARTRIALSSATPGGYREFILTCNRAPSVTHAARSCTAFSPDSAPLLRLPLRSGSRALAARDPALLAEGGSCGTRAPARLRSTARQRG